MPKFKKGDRVRYIGDTTAGFLTKGDTGTVDDDFNSPLPWVSWDHNVRHWVEEDLLELASSQKLATGNIGLINTENAVKAHCPEPVSYWHHIVAGKTREQWLFEFAGQAMSTFLLKRDSTMFEPMARDAYISAKALLNTLEEKIKENQ